MLKEEGAGGGGEGGKANRFNRHSTCVKTKEMLNGAVEAKFKCF